jgi:hypothetical protein
MKTKILTTAVLIVAILLLAFELHRIRDDTQSLHALSDTLDREVSTLVSASALPATSKQLTAPSTAPTTTSAPATAAKTKPLPPGVFASYSDTNVMGDP